MEIDVEFHANLGEDIKALLNHTPGGIYSVLRHLNGTRELKFVSPKFLEITEFTTEDLTGPQDPIPARIHPDDLPQLEKINHEAARSFEEIHTQFRFICPSGVTKEIEGFARCQQLDGVGLLWTGIFIDISQRKKFEQLLHTHEQLNQRINMMVKLSPGGLYNMITHQDGSSQLVFGSPKFYEMTGITEEEAMANPTITDDLLHPDSRQKIFEANQRALATMSFWHEEFKLLKKDGRAIHVEGLSFPNRETDGSVLWYGLIIDITERKQAQRTLLERMSLERDLHNISELSPAAHAIFRQEINGSLHPVFVSRKMKGFFGANSSLLNHESFVKQIHADDLQAFQTARSGALNRVESFREEFRFVDQDGTEVWYELRVQPIPQGDGTVLWYSMLTNIDQRKNLEAARRIAFDLLKESEEKYRHLAENIEVPITLVDEEGTVLYVNGALASMLGRNAKDIIGVKWSTLAPDSWQQRKAILKTVLSTNTKVTVETPILLNDEERWFRLVYQPVTVHGKVAQVLITAFEISKAKT